jgi:redox-sensitive bicupin YhaK (pirin superfamily)
MNAPPSWAVSQAPPEPQPPRAAKAMRRVKATHRALRDDIADLRTRRPLPAPGLDRLGAFLFLNHHGPQAYRPGNRGLPFGPHPHRGFETVTFVLEGELAHRDSAGHESVIGTGGVQWMTAGRGLVHAEVSPEAFMRDGGPLEILQLWVNLPARLKMTAPRYVSLQRDDIPAFPVDDGKATVRLIAGTFDGHEGPIVSITGVMMSIIGMKSGAQMRLDGLGGRDVFLYVVRGRVKVADRLVADEHLVELEGDGDAVALEAASDAVLLFGHADPIDEPVVAHGPFVMNTRAEIEQAIRDYQAGKFDAIVG